MSRIQRRWRRDCLVLCYDMRDKVFACLTFRHFAFYNRVLVESQIFLLVSRLKHPSSIITSLRFTLAADLSFEDRAHSCDGPTPKIRLFCSLCHR